MNAQAPPRRALALATAAYVLGWTAHTTFVLYLAPIVLRLAGEGGRDAWVFSGTAVASILMALPAGRLTDRFPRRRVMRGGLLLLALSYAPLILAPPSFGATLLATAITGSGLALLFVAFNAYVPDLLRKGSLANAYGQAGAISVLLSALGPLAAAGVFRFVDGEGVALRINAWAFAVASLVAVALTLLLPGTRRGERPPRVALRDAWQSERAIVIATGLIYLFLGAGYGMTMPYFAVYFLDHVPTPKETWGVVLAVATLASALGSLLVGRLSGRFRPGTLVLAPQVGLLIASVVFLAPLPLVALAAAFTVRNLFSATTAPMVNAIAMPDVAAQARGRVQAWGSLTWNVGWAAGAAGGGLLLARLGGATFPVGAVVGLFGVAAGLRMLVRQR